MPLVRYLLSFLCPLEFLCHHSDLLQAAADPLPPGIPLWMLLLPSCKCFLTGHTQGQDPLSMSQCSVRALAPVIWRHLKDKLHLQGVCLNQRHLLCTAASWGYSWRKEVESQLCKLCRGRGGLGKPQ